LLPRLFWVRLLLATANIWVSYVSFGNGYLALAASLGVTLYYLGRSYRCVITRIIPVHTSIICCITISIWGLLWLFWHWGYIYLGFRIGLGLSIDENRWKGSKEDSYPNTADDNSSYKQHLTNIYHLKQAYLNTKNIVWSHPNFGMITRLLRYLWFYKLEYWWSCLTLSSLFLVPCSHFHFLNVSSVLCSLHINILQALRWSSM
jgi:hypothetical protein